MGRHNFGGNNLGVRPGGNNNFGGKSNKMGRPNFGGNNGLGAPIQGPYGDPNGRPIQAPSNGFPSNAGGFPPNFGGQ